MDLLHQVFHAIRFERDATKAIHLLPQDTGLAQAQWHGSEKYVKGSTPLHYAAEYAFIELMRELVEFGADVNANTAHDNGTPLAWAADAGEADAVQFLLEHGADPTADVGGGRTALHCAAAGGLSEGHKHPDAYAETARLLIQHGADVNAAATEDGTPLDVALQHANEPVAEVLRRRGGKAVISEQ